MITTALIVRVVYLRQRHPDMEKYILTFVRGSGSVRVHLSTILRVQVWFRFTEVKFCWFRFGSGSPKWNGSFGFTVRVQVRFDFFFFYSPGFYSPMRNYLPFTVGLAEFFPETSNSIVAQLFKITVTLTSPETSSSLLNNYTSLIQCTTF